MRIWVDPQLPPACARWLTNDADVHAQHVADVELLKAKDPKIFSPCSNDVGRHHKSSGFRAGMFAMRSYVKLCSPSGHKY